MSASKQWFEIRSYAKFAALVVLFMLISGVFGFPPKFICKADKSVVF